MNLLKNKRLKKMTMIVIGKMQVKMKISKMMMKSGKTNQAMKMNKMNSK